MKTRRDPPRRRIDGDPCSGDRARAPWRCVRHLACLALLAASPTFAAELVEQTVEVPVTVQVPDGHLLTQNITMTIVREAAAEKRPFIVLQHGRGGTAAERRAMGRQSYPANSRYFAGKGFVVLIPTRIGYGVSGGPDVEYTGNCRSKRFADGVVAAVRETRQLLEYSRQLPYVDSDRGIVLGESFGGVVAVAVAASDIHGIVAAVNISGGDGGDVRRHPDEPCRPDQMRDTFAQYGRDNHLPTLWMYSANDRVWGQVYPKQWYAAFVEAGGRGQFVALPADKNNGHFIFNRNPPAWQPAFESFASQFGLMEEPR
jgi:dienelactone hydrolase